MSTRVFGARQSDAGISISGPTPRARLGDVKHFNGGINFGGSSLASSANNQRLRPADNRSGLIAPSPRIGAGFSGGNTHGSANSGLLSSRGGQSRTLKPLSKIIPEQQETDELSQPITIKRNISPRSGPHYGLHRQTSYSEGSSVPTPEIRIG
eukprot:TRINITY_DN10884_c0_g1_i1.p1 TRINITY_DN10884_c0_g1~~TRINITY_DN10884_c0_g1_i1.p1  ORF type:complete len:153 (-),score=12.90 TRINITY_DN10884_c0_g1_i1:281-739(-)